MYLDEKYLSFILTLTSYAMHFALVTANRSIPMHVRNSEVVYVKQGEIYQLECPISSGLTLPHRILWLLPGVYVVVSESGTEAREGYPNGKLTFIQSTGQLEIYNISEADEGIYRCVVVERRNQTCSYRASGVNLKIRKPPRENARKEYSKSGNATRAMIVAGGVLLFFVLFFTVYHFRWRKPANSDTCHFDEDAGLPGESVKGSNAENEDTSPGLPKQLNTLEPPSQNYFYIDNPLGMKPSSDRIYTLPESSRSFTSKKSAFSLQTQEDSNFSPGRMLMLTSDPKQLQEDDIDGLSPPYPLHSPPFRFSSLQQAREKRSQAKTWWMNQLPCTTTTKSSIASIPPTCPIITTSRTVDRRDDYESQNQPHV